jgi:uncharacterized protein (TIGR03437 family)
MRFDLLWKHFIRRFLPLVFSGVLGTWFSAPLLALPDLTVTSLLTAANAPVGGSLSVSEAIVRNNGTAASGLFRVAFYFSTDATITTSDVLSTVCLFGAGLAAGATADCKDDIPVPSTLPAGTYFIGVIADYQSLVAESDETNNTRLADSDPVTLGPSNLPDLVVTSLRAGSTAAIGATLPLTELIVRNDGSVPAGSFQVGLYFDPFTATRTYSGFSCGFPSLAAGETGTCSGDVPVPISLSAPGNYFLRAIADDLGEVTEGNELNNRRLADTGGIIITTSSQPDLMVTSLRSVSASTIGGTLSVSELVVRNNGAGSAGAFRVGIYFSTDQTITISDTFSGFSCSIEGLAAGANNTCGGDISVPGGLAAGTYYLGARADDLNQVSEVNSENNNTRVADTGQVTLAVGNTPQIAEGGVVSAASFAGPALTPGGIYSVFGSRLTNFFGIAGAAAIPLPTSIENSSVRINGILVPLFATAGLAGLEQINFQAPWELAGQSVASIVVENNGIASSPLQVNVLTAQPGVFTVDGTVGIFIHSATGELVTAQNPAKKGEVLVAYLTGLGPVTNQPPTGFAAGVPLSETTNTPIVIIGGLNATVKFSGLTPSLVGLYQINLEVPPTAPSGNLDVVVQVAGQTSKVVKLSVQ